MTKLELKVGHQIPPPPPRHPDETNQVSRSLSGHLPWAVSSLLWGEPAPLESLAAEWPPIPEERAPFCNNSTKSPRVQICQDCIGLEHTLYIYIDVTCYHIIHASYVFVGMSHTYAFFLHSVKSYASWDDISASRVTQFSQVHLLCPLCFSITNLSLQTCETMRWFSYLLVLSQTVRQSALLL